MIIKKLKFDKKGSYFFGFLMIYFLICIFMATGRGGGGLLNQISAVSFIAYCFFYITKSYGNKTYLLKTLMTMITIIVSRDIVYCFQDPTMVPLYVRGLFLMLFWMIGFVFSLRCFHLIQQSDVEDLSKILIIETLLYLCYAVYLQQSRIAEEDDLMGAISTAGSAYMLIPLILICFRGRVKLILLMLCMVLCAFSQKRKAMIGFVLVLIFILPDLIKVFYRQYKLGSIILICILAIFGSNIFFKIFGGLLRRQEAMVDSDRVLDNGREMLREAALKGFENAPIYDQLFGGGCGAGGRYIKQYIGHYLAPHNAFVDVLCSYGIIGVILYSSIFISIFKMLNRYRGNAIVYRLSLGVLLAWCFTSFFTHPGVVWNIFFCIYFGYIFTFYPDKETKEIDNIILY